MASENRIALFIDGPNFHGTVKALGLEVDYSRLLSAFSNRGKLVRAFYFSPIVEDQEYSAVRPLLDWLDYNGYAVVTKAAKEYLDVGGRRRVKGDIGIELAVAAMELSGYIDELVLLSGDGNLRPLVEAVQRRGVRVTVASTISTSPAIIADELRRQADAFIEIAELRPLIERE